MSETSSQSQSRPVSEATEQVVTPAARIAEKTPAKPPVPDPTRYGDREKNGRCIDF